MASVFAKIYDINQSVIKRDSMKVLFRDYMEESCNIEIWLFLDKCKKYQRTTRCSQRYIMAQKIYLTHVQKMSEYEINLSQNDRDVFYKIYSTISLSDCPLNLFEELMNKNKLVINNQILSLFLQSDLLIYHFYNKLTNERSGVKIKDRRHHLVKYKRCFVGKDLVTWLLLSWKLKNRKNATKIATTLHNLGWFEHVTGDHDFKDKFLYYRMAVEMKNGKMVKINKKQIRLKFPRKIFGIPLKTPRKKRYSTDSDTVKRSNSLAVISTNMGLLKSPKSKKVSVVLLKNGQK